MAAEPYAGGPLAVGAYAAGSTPQPDDPSLARPAGLPALQLRVRDATGAYPPTPDYASRIDLTAGWSVSRGRTDEFDDVDPTQGRWTLNNNDGAFSPGGALAPGTWVQLRVVLGGLTFVRFTGPIDAMPLTWPSPIGNLCEVPVEAIDSQRTLSDVDDPYVLGGNLIDEVLYDPARPLLGAVTAPAPGPVVVQYVPLSDVEGETAATVYGPRVPGMTRAALASTTLGLPDIEPPDFGGTDDVLPDPEATTGARFYGDQWLTSPTPLAGGKSLTIAWRTDDPSTGTSSVLAGVLAQPGSGAPHVFLAIRDGQLRLLHYGPGTVPAEPAPTESSYLALVVSTPIVPVTGWDPVDGQWHMAVVRYDTNVAYVQTDADPVGQLEVATGLGVGFRLQGTLVIGGVDPRVLAFPPDKAPVEARVAPFTGSLGQVAVHGAGPDGSPITTGRSAGLVTALRGNPGDTARDRVARLFRLAGVAFDLTGSDPGVLTQVPAQATAGRAVWDCVDEVADAEGGLVLVDTATGTPVLQGRTRRVLNATASAPAVALGPGDVEHDDLRVEVGGRKAPVPTFGLLPETDQRRIDGEAWFRTRPDRPRLSKVTVDLLTLDDVAKVRALLGLRIGDALNVAGLPVQAPFGPAELIVEGWSEKCTQTEWSITFNTVAAADSRAWVLGDPVYGVLGETTVLHY